MKKIIAPFLVFAVLFTACYSVKKADKFISTIKLPAVAKSAPVANLKVTIDEKSFFDSIPDQAQLKKAGRYFIPLPFVAFWKANYYCTPGKQTFKDSLIQNITSSVNSAMANVLPAGNTSAYELILKQESSNFKFKYNNKGFIVVLLIVTFGNKKEFVSPVTMDMTLNYQLKKDGVVIKSGKVTQSKQITEKIEGDTPLPYVNDPLKTPTQNANAMHYQFAAGDAGKTIKNGMLFGLVEYNNMMREAVSAIAGEAKKTIQQ